MKSTHAVLDGAITGRAVELFKPQQVNRDYFPVFETFEGFEDRGAEVHNRPVTQLESVEVVDSKASTMLAPEEATYRLLAEHATDVISRHSPEGIFLYVSPACQRLLGYEPDDLVGHSIYELFHPEDLPAAEDRTLSGLLGKEVATHSFRLRRDDGRYAWFEATIRNIRDPHTGRVKEFVAVSRDITDRLKTEARIKTYEERYRKLFERSLSGIFLSTLDGQLLDCNKAFVKIFGYDSRQEMLTRGTLALFESPIERQEYVNQLLRKGRITNLELCLQRRDGSPVWVLENVSLIEDENGQPILLEGMVMDITRLKHTESKLRNSQTQLRTLATHLQTVREEEKTRIAREIHDELGGTLTGLKFELCAIGDRFAEEDDDAHEQLDKLSSLVDETIKTVRRIATSLRPVSLDALGLRAAIEALVHEFKKRTGIHCELTVGSRELDLDQSRSTALYRILQESLTNVARHASADSVRIRLRQADGQVTLLVRDDGRGVCQEELENLRSLGVTGMRERLTPWHGDLKIVGVKDKGTALRARIPI